MVNQKVQAAPDTASEQKLLEEMDEALALWSDSATRLREALQNDELQLHHQPILALRTGRFEMSEVLVRLREEETLLLPPGEFLPAFEHCGMLPDLDRWVVRKVLQRLHDEGAGSLRSFGINVSSQTLEDSAMPRFIAKELMATGLAPDSLYFEIDESDVLSRLGPATEFATAVKTIGCRVAIDGFGRRSVSFAPLKGLPVDFLKVDGSIVRNILRSDIALRKLDAMIRVGQAVGFDLIAECVEEQDVLARLKGLGVGYAQGFGICEPQPMEKLARSQAHT